MQFLGRQTRQADFEQARQLITDRFLYDSDDFAALAGMWRQIIEGESGYSGVVARNTADSVLAFGISVALKPQFLERALADPQPFTSKRILEAWKRGDSPIMSREEVAQANAGWGIDLFVLHHGYAPMKDAAEDYEVLVALAAQFLQMHAGLNLRTMTQEFYDRSWLDITPRFGFTLRHNFGKSFIAGIRRSEVIAAGRGEFVIDALFAHSPAPRLGLDAALRQALRTALEGEAQTNDGSVLRWNDLFDRIRRIDSATASFAGKGTQARNHVLAWLRSHPEELHPYATPGVTR